jgi:hypothetical protein
MWDWYVCRVQLSWPFPVLLLPDVITGAEEDDDSEIPGLRARVTGWPAFLRASMNEMDASLTRHFL